MIALPSLARLRARLTRLLGMTPMLLALMAIATGARATDPVKGTVKVYTDDGYARLIFRLDDRTSAKVSVSGAVMIINFSKPVDIAVDRINASAPTYISAARRDPDGMAVRLALARKVKVNTIPAGEWLYVDLLPDDWKGVMPGLPQEVIDELARRAREAEQQLRRQRAQEHQQTPAAIRVKVAAQPTFVRYVFDMPEQVNVVPEDGKGTLTLSFDLPIKWDLADALAALPPTLKAIAATSNDSGSKVTFVLNGAPQVHNFREDNSIVVDVGLNGAKPKEKTQGPAQEKQQGKATAPGGQSAAATPAPPIEAPATVPAAAMPPAEKKSEVAEKPKPAAPPQQAAPKPEAKAAVAPAAHLPELAAAAPPAETMPRLSPPATAPAHPAPVPQMAAQAEKPPAAPVPPVAKPNPNAPVVVGLHCAGNTLHLEFPFAAPAAAAVFRRADTLWLVFDSAQKIDLSALSGEDASHIIRDSKLERGSDGEAIVRLRLAQPALVNVAADAASWLVTIGDTSAAPSQPLIVARGLADKNRANISIPFDNPQKIHDIKDPDIGDRLLVVTGLGPPRGFLKTQDFVELRALASTQGVVLEPLADDLHAELSSDRITVSRPRGLTLSSGAIGERAANTFTFNPLLFDTEVWGFDRQAKYRDRQNDLIERAANAPPAKRYQARLNLARFYLARDMGAEAKGVLDVALGDLHGEDVTGTVLKGIADVMLHRSDDALKVLSSPTVGDQFDAPIWRAIALSHEGKWSEARDQFRTLEGAIGRLPVELQREALREALRSAIAVHDYTGATRMFDQFDTLGVPPGYEASMAVLTGRLDEGLGRTEDALAAYRLASAAGDRRAAAQARLRNVALRYSLKTMSRKDAIAELETLTTVWRGDETEAEGLKLLAHLYTEDGRYRAAFHVMRTAMLAHPNSEITRQIQDEAAATFESLFLGGKGDALPPVEALGLFYDYRDLTPIGRRGDEMIRKLADRLVSVDLLDQAAELLQHQVDHRLQGAARAQVATRLAVIYLMNRKPDRALATLQSTRTAELANEVRDQRLLLEARALSDIGRRDVALEVISGLKSREAMRLRADILWAAKRWRAAGEQMELLYGGRWHDFAPLSDGERFDILRAAIAYALADETMSLARLRERYAAKMANTPDQHAFDVVSAPVGVSGAEFQDIAKTVTGADTLDAFLRDMRKRYPDLSTAAGDNAPPPSTKPSAAAKPATPPAKPAAAVAASEKAAANASAKPAAAPAPAPAKPAAAAPAPRKSDATPTGSIGKRAAARS